MAEAQPLSPAPSGSTSEVDEPQASCSTTSPTRAPQKLKPIVVQMKPEDQLPVKNFMDTEEGHKYRLKQLRKELEYLEATAWKYPPIEHYIGY